eukprot:CAMPEP_0180327142 /NCGR_PEP_ID=MMETSP0988-20121125/39391_1 /TAXON_ID=697907 /ORGANISM="non described non described, Strain CCMP2293" /LENGTH=186 /DNA_ID=CAMNT_0022313801 /DNA_START=54 /DNA_END=612 /DNA_ORIENTATION=+
MAGGRRMPVAEAARIAQLFPSKAGGGDLRKILSTDWNNLPSAGATTSAYNAIRVLRGEAADEVWKVRKPKGGERMGGNLLLESELRERARKRLHEEARGALLSGDDADVSVEESRSFLSLLPETPDPSVPRPKYKSRFAPPTPPPPTDADENAVHPDACDAAEEMTPAEKRAATRAAREREREKLG